MSGFLRWLAPQYADVRKGLRNEVARLRGSARAEGQHARTPGIVADLAIAWRCWLDYAQAAGAISQAERDTLESRVWAALQEDSASQAEHLATAEPCGHFLRLLTAVLASGKAHFVGPDGGPPADAEAWGWRKTEIRIRDGADTRWDPLGYCIGWIDGPDLYLDPDAAFAETQKLARDQGDNLPIACRTLWQRLRERNLLASWDVARKRNTVRRKLGCKERTVLHLSADVLSTGIRPSEPSTGLSEECKMGEKRPVPDGSVNRTIEATGLSIEIAGKTGKNRPDGRSGRSHEEEEDPMHGSPNTPVESETKPSQGRTLSQEDGPYGGNGF